MLDEATAAIDLETDDLIQVKRIFFWMLMLKIFKESNPDGKYDYRMSVILCRRELVHILFFPSLTHNVIYSCTSKILCRQQSDVSLPR